MKSARRKLEENLSWLIRERDLSGPVSRSCMDLAAANGLAAVLWTILKRRGELHSLDQQDREYLHSRRDFEIAQHLRITAAASALLEAFAQAGIEVMVLKGLALRSALYSPLGLVRTPGDLDLLIEDAAIARAPSILEQAGYIPVSKHDESFYRNHHHIQPHQLAEDRSILVDVHRTLVANPNPYNLDLTSCRQRSVQAEGMPEGVRRLCDEDLALHLAMQLDHDDAYGGKGRALFELAFWISQRQVPVEVLRERAAFFRAGNSLRRAFAMLQYIFPEAGIACLEEPDHPRGWRASLWRKAVETALWLPPRENRIPAWYVQHCARCLGEDDRWWDLMRNLIAPILSNPRLGGHGYDWH